jgi:hypothetical protein
MNYYPSLANVVTQADCSRGLNVRSAEGKAIACQSTEGRRRLERSGRHLRGRIDQSGGRGDRLNIDSGVQLVPTAVQGVKIAPGHMPVAQMSQAEIAAPIAPRGASGGKVMAAAYGLCGVQGYGPTSFPEWR